MGVSTAFANRGKILVAATELAVVKDVEVVMSAEFVPLYGWGSIIRQAVAKHSFKCSVKIGWVKFDNTLANFPMNIFGTAGVGVSTNNTNTVTTFSVVAEFYFEESPTSKITGTIGEVFFPEFPLKAAEGQWVKVDVSGEGSTIAWAKTA